MSKFLVTDTITQQLYPAADLYEVEQVIEYITDDWNYGDTYDEEFGQLIQDARLMDQGFDLGTIAYPTLNVSLRRIDV